jgi:hypothetical protein
MTRTNTRWLLAAIAPGALLALAGTLRGDGPPEAKDAVTVSLCDGESQLAVPGLKPDQALARPEAQQLADRMLQVWRSSQGEARWASWSAEMEAARAAAPLRALAAHAAEGPAQQADQPTKFTQRDQLLWKREEKKWVDEGYKNFHNAKALGGTIGISCDMCHPDGSNTHPESYPKFQVQTKKMALLRDMINWCIENPMKGKPLPEDDPRLRSVEAYILSTRKGVALEPGKH